MYTKKMCMGTFIIKIMIIEKEKCREYVYEDVECVSNLLKLMIKGALKRNSMSVIIWFSLFETLLYICLKISRADKNIHNFDLFEIIILLLNCLI